MRNNDFIPEEEEQAYQQILAALRSSPSRHVPIAAEEQAQIITRVRVRLALAKSLSLSPDASTLPSQPQFTPHPPTRQARKPRYQAAHLLAALVVLGLILGSWALFKAYRFSSSSTPVTGPGPVATTQAGGLEASLHVLIGGPYFLSELLPVDVSLTNHTTKTLVLGGTNAPATLCFKSALMVQIMGGGDPSYTLPNLDIACALPAIATEVKPGQTMMIHQYVPLTKSGEIALTMQEPTVDAFNGHWPTIHMQVSPQIPPGRTLSLQKQPGEIVINAPAGTQPHLLYMQNIDCPPYYGSPETRDGWTPLAGTILREPTCPAPHPHWSYIVSAPGYAIASGSLDG